MSPSAVQAVLLAGGRSSRMGRDKALLLHPDSGRPLILHQLETLRAAGCGDLLLSVRQGQDYPVVPADIPRIHDSGDAGPFAALEAALARATAPLLLVLAVDLPFVTPGRLRALLARCAPEQGVVPCHPAPGPGAGAFEPLCAVYPNASCVRAAVSSARSAGRFSLQGLLAGAVAAGWMHPLPLAPADLPSFANWNSPADLPAL